MKEYREYKAKAEGYKSLMVLGLMFGFFGAIGRIVNPFFFLLLPFGILLIIVGIIGYAYYISKYSAYAASTRRYCKFCGAELSPHSIFCPVCGRAQE